MTLLTALAALRVPVCVAASPGDAFGHLAAAAASVLRTDVVPLPATDTGLAAFLDRPFASWAGSRNT